ncbi:MAG: hypothetical protein ACR2HH_13355 [Chthoniobacterales bacterium]
MRPATFVRAAVHLYASLTSCLLLNSCASNSSPRAEIAPPPRYLELQDEPAISTFHFPRGLYSLDSEDRAGYYYRSPRGLMKHSFAGFAKYDGGVFLPRVDRARLRGYVVWAGGVTKIGNLSRARYVLRD